MSSRICPCLCHSLLRPQYRYFASGTGAAGLVGAFLWWEIRGLGVRVGVGLSSVMPFVIPLTYFFLLPSTSEFLYIDSSSSSYEERDLTTSFASLPYTPLAAAEDQVGEEEGSILTSVKRDVALTGSDKWRLVQPMLLKYMFPLCESPLFHTHASWHLLMIQRPVSLRISGTFIGLPTT